MIDLTGPASPARTHNSPLTADTPNDPGPDTATDEQRNRAAELDNR
jgi:hypothetical protein